MWPSSIIAVWPAINTLFVLLIGYDADLTQQIRDLYALLYRTRRDSFGLRTAAECDRLFSRNNIPNQYRDALASLPAPSKGAPPPPLPPHRDMTVVRELTPSFLATNSSSLGNQSADSALSGSKSRQSFGGSADTPKENNIHLP